LINIKKNFVVSNLKNIWIKNSKKLYLSDPYIYHFLERENDIINFEKVEFAKYLRKTKKDLQDDSDYVDSKYEKYIKIISKRLNKIHNKNYELSFWKKSLSMGFIRYITTLYNMFKTCENYFDLNKHDCNILSNHSYITPNDFEDHRAIFQNSDFGQEQIFSIYINLFYPKTFSKIELINPLLKTKKISFLNKIKNNYKLKTLYQNIKYRTLNRGIKIGILGSYFSKKNISKLLKESKNNIGLLNIPKLSYNSNKPLNNRFRKILSFCEEDFDKFDKFFFTSLFYCFPKIFIEEFIDFEKLFLKRIKNFKSLNYIVSENWISDTQNSIFLALAKSRSVRHISNEHNCFFHPFAGSYLNHVIDMSDFFTTLGWNDASNKKIIKSGSLFEFSIKQKKIKKHNILFISGAITAKATHFSGAYGYCEEKAMNSVNFNISFFKNLRNNTLNKITYRGYPSERLSHIQLFNKEFFYRDIQEKFIKSNKNVSSKKQMSESKLVIIDYISTAYIESILMNIPTVFFWDKNSYYLNDKNKHFFKPLIEVGICQTSPKEASLFIEKIKDNPNIWWNSLEVRNAKQTFISKNLGSPQLLLDFLINLSQD